METTKNTFSKYVPNVFLAKCAEKQNKGETIILTTKYGKDVEVEVFNLIYTKDSFYFYSFVRTDGYNAQTRAQTKAEKLEGFAVNAEKRANSFYEASQEGKDFLSLSEPIKIGHHSERRHRALIERNWSRMGKSVAESEKAADYQRRAEFWANKASIINLSMPESLNYFEFELEKAVKYHQLLKDNPGERSHSMSLQYANKTVKDLRDKLQTALRLWGDEEDIVKLDAEKKQESEQKASKNTKKNDIVKRHHGFFAFNTEQFRDGYDKLRVDGIVLEDEKVCHVGYGLYIPKKNVDSFLIEYKK